MPNQFTVAVKVAASGHFEWTQYLAPSEREQAKVGRVVQVGTSQIAPGHAVVLNVSGVELPSAALHSGLRTDQWGLLP